MMFSSAGCVGFDFSRDLSRALIVAIRAREARTKLAADLRKLPPDK
ncbi:MAG: hypothetical protein P8P99_03660 [Maricaulis sp.]|nr:hypothetical protein [Maricaulis sp.]